MTCEVAVMNKLGVALAADSAVTLGEGPKTYHNAEKLFQLSSGDPIAIMTYGSAEMMGVPWETIIKIYARKHGGAKFDRLEQHSRAFLQYIESAESLFPEVLQRVYFRNVVGSYWSGCFLHPLEEELEAKSQGSAKHANHILEDLIDKDLKWWEDNSAIIQDLGDTYGEKVHTEYSATLDELESDVFGRFQLTKQIREKLRLVDTLLFTRDSFENFW